MKTDEQIKKDVQRELTWDTRTWKLKLLIGAKNGVITLDGAVENYADRLAAQNAAHRVKGVMDVVNNIVVRSKRPFTDEEIAHGVRQSLKWGVKVPDDRITTTVSDGWVTIQGTVDSLTEREDAEWAIENLIGVKGVVNEIEVIVPKSDPETLRHAIEAALERRADREAKNFKIEVNDGEVNIRGRVHSWQERKAIVGSIIPMPGVSKINDNLRVDPYF